MDKKHWTQVLEEWFNPENDSQLTAFAHIRATGMWPECYLETVPYQVQEAISQSNGMWNITIYRMLGDAYMRNKGVIE